MKMPVFHYKNMLKRYPSNPKSKSQVKHPIRIKLRVGKGGEGCDGVDPRGG